MLAVVVLEDDFGSEEDVELEQSCRKATWGKDAKGNPLPENDPSVATSKQVCMTMQFHLVVICNNLIRTYVTLLMKFAMYLLLSSARSM